MVSSLRGHKSDSAMFFDKRDAPARVGWMPSLPIRPGFPQKDDQLSMKPTSFAGHHLDSQRLNDDMRLYMSSLVRLGKGPEKITESDIFFAKEHTDSMFNLVTSDWRRRESFVPTWRTILANLRLLFASNFKFASMSPALAPGIHLTMPADFAIFTFLTMESPIISVCSPVGGLPPSPRGENLLET